MKNLKLQVECCRSKVLPNSRKGLVPACNLQPSTSNFRRAFSLVEIMVVMALLSLIVIALMAVFSSTQTAFRASVTQSDVLEGGRATIDLIAQDLKELAPSGGSSNALNFTTTGVNFYVGTNFYDTQPLIQSLVGSSDGAQRTNVLQNIFILSRDSVGGHDTWIGTGYAVDATNGDYPLYRFNMQTNAAARPWTLFNTYMTAIVTNGFTGPGWSHMLDGVVQLTVNAYDPNGYRMTNSRDFYNGRFVTNQNTYFLPPTLGESSFYMFSNTLPASVEVQLGMLEDRIRQRAESIPVAVTRSNYLAQQAGKVHLFRQRVTIPNVDPAAYQ